MKLERALRTISYSTTLGASIGFFSGAYELSNTPPRNYDFSGLIPPMYAGIGAGIGFSLGVGAAILQEVIDLCKNQQNENQIAIRPR